MLRSLGGVARSWVANINPWTNVYGMARSLLAIGTAATLLFNQPHILFRPASGLTEYPICQGPSKIGIFCLCSPHIGLARWLAIAVLIVTASGWRPRWTAIPHWWITFSLETSAITLDGGDQVAAVLTLLLIPIALTDKRRWHWQQLAADTPLTLGTAMRRLVAVSTLIALRIQVAGIYLHAAVAKWSVKEWSDGTTLYYWFNDPFIGLPGWLRPLMMPVLTSPVVAIFTWCSLILELMLFAALVMPKQKWRIMLIAGILFHCAIAVTMGLISFGLAMTAALVLYLRPVEKEFGLSFSKIAMPQFATWFRRQHRAEPQSTENVPATSSL